MNRRMSPTSLLLGMAIAIGNPLYQAPSAGAQEHKLTERLFRTVLTSVKPIYAAGHEGNPREVIGFHTESTVFEITEPIQKGIIPRQLPKGVEPIGRLHGELRLMGNARVDRSQPMQIFVGTAHYEGRNMKFDAKGTSIIHWVQGAEGKYHGIRWTDFSGTITHLEGRREGSHGHLVGTRLLVGDPEEHLQSGLIILRLMD